MGVTTLFLAAMAPGLALAEWPERPITFIVPYSPGGGFDALARAVAPRMGEILGTEVVVENVAGASGQRGAATVYRAEPDGYTIGMYNLPGFSIAQVTGMASGFDLSDVTWLGNLSSEQYGLIVKADNAVTSVAELCDMGRPVKVASTGLGSTADASARITMQVLDCPYSMVTGYQGSTESIVAVIRGDVDAVFANLSSAMNFSESGDVKVILTLTDERSIEGVQTSSELGHESLHLISLARMVAAPPGLPADLQQRLSDALVAAANDPEVQARSIEANREIHPVGFEEAENINEALLELVGQFAEFFR